MKATEIQIRQLSSEDAVLYKQIRLEALKLNPEAFASDFETESKKPLGFYEENIKEVRIFGAFNNSEIVGMVGLVIKEGLKLNHKGLIWGVYVKGEYRGRGIAKRLMQTALNCAKEQVELVQLSVVKDNKSAYNLYVSLGFEEYGLEKHAIKYQEQYFDDVLMVRNFKEKGAGHS